MILTVALTLPAPLRGHRLNEDHLSHWRARCYHEGLSCLGTGLSDLRLVE